ncbi:MAG: MFS transporter [Mycobacterium sp.]
MNSSPNRGPRSPSLGDRSPLSFSGFRRLFIARAISSSGSYMQIVAATWYAYKITGSAASVGLLSAVALGPAIVGGPIGGALADRYEPRRLSMVLYLLQGIPATVLAILDIVGDLPVGWLYVLVFAGAIPYSLNCPVISLVGTYTVPEEYRQAAVAQSSMMFNITRLVGAVAGGFMVHWMGIGTAFAFNAASYFLVAAVLSRTSLVSDAVKASMPHDRAESTENVGLQSLTRMAAVGVGVFFTFIAPVEQLMPTVAEEHGMTAAAVGLLIGAIGVGAVLANPIIGKANTSPASRRRLMSAGLFLAAPGMVVLAVTPHHGLPIDIFGAMLIGFGWEFVFIGGQSTVAIEVPDKIRGRMMGLFFVLVTATTAVGAVGLGLLINALGIMTTFLITAAVVIAAGSALLALPIPSAPGAATG